MPDTLHKASAKSLPRTGIWLVALFLWACSDASEAPKLGTQAFTRVLHRIAFEPELWETVSHGPGGAAEVRVITPSMATEEDGADLAGLLLPPPCTVRLIVPDDGGPVWLKGRTGLDLSARAALPADTLGVEITLAVSVDGEEVWSNAHILRRQPAPDEGFLWQDLPPIPLRPGQELLFSSRISLPLGQADLPRLPVGFGQLEIVQDGEQELAAATAARPSIVLIVMDTLRQDHLSCYGYKAGTTPALDSLAERGILFENAYATASWTWPATASILTGLAPEAHGVVSASECLLNPSVETLPELLAERGLVTGAITCNPLIVADKNFDQGFDYFDSAHKFRRSTLVIGAARDWLRLHAGVRFFLYVQLVDTHELYHPLSSATLRVGGHLPADYPKSGMDAYHQDLLDGRGHDALGHSRLEELVPPAHLEWMALSYEAAVISADHFVGQLLIELEALGLEESTVVAFTSDHGEELGDHGLLIHGHSLYPELLRVPLILAGPGLPRGARVDTPVSNRHLAPSLAALAGASFENLTGSIDLLTPAAVTAQPVYFSTQTGFWNGRRDVALFGLREGGWELHWAPEGAAWGATETGAEGDVRLFCVSEDPEQHDDLAAEQPKRVAEMLRTLRQELARNQALHPGQSLGAGKRSIQALIDIGYLGTDSETEEDAD